MWVLSGVDLQSAGAGAASSEAGLADGPPALPVLEGGPFPGLRPHSLPARRTGGTVWG